MRRRILLTFMVAMLFATGVSAQKKTRTVNLYGHVKNSFTKVGIPNTKITLMTDDSTVIDTFRVSTYGGRTVKVGTQFKRQIPAEPRKYIILAQHPEYHDCYVDFEIKHVARNTYFDAPHHLMVRKNRMDDLNQMLDQVEVKATKVKLAYNGDTIVFSLYRNATHWGFHVVDHGIGISSGEQDKLFRQLFRGANAINAKILGSGIGLLSIGRYVKAMKGKIEVSSQLNQGADFHVRFPLGKEQYDQHSTLFIENPHEKDVVSATEDKEPDNLHDDTDNRTLTEQVHNIICHQEQICADAQHQNDGQQHKDHCVVLHHGEEKSADRVPFLHIFFHTSPPISPTMACMTAWEWSSSLGNSPIILPSYRTMTRSLMPRTSGVSEEINTMDLPSATRRFIMR